MAARKTDPDRWEKQWYRELSINGQRLWDYLCDKVTWAGFYKIDKFMITTFVKIPEDEIDELLADENFTKDIDINEG